MFPTLSSPVNGPSFVASGWADDRSYRGAGKTHEGLDFVLRLGDPVRAAAPGVVTNSFRDDGPAGEMITVQHEGGLVTRYMHLDRRLVAKGATVARGQVLGTGGTSGTKESGPHLHFDVQWPVAKIAEYVARFGRPSNGFGTTRGAGIGVPAEPLVPVDRYAPKVVQSARAHGIPLYKAVSPFLLLAFGVGAYLILRR